MKYFKITYQDYDYECGVCVLTTLYNFFYDKNISKTLLFQELVFSKSGMTINEFEENAKQIGIDCLSYKLSFEEFIKIKNNSLCVLCIQQENNLLHYVIVKKENNCFIVFDSLNGKTNYSLNEFRKIFSNFVIVVKKNFNYKIIDVEIPLKQLNVKLNYKFLIINIFSELLVFILSIIISSYLKIYMDLIIPNNSYPIYFLFFLFFVLVYLLNYFFKIFFQFYKIKIFQFWFKKNFYLIQKILISKPKKFFDKFDKELLYQYIDFLILKIEKNIFLIPDLLFDAFVFIIITIIVGMNNYLFLIVILINNFCLFGISIFKKNNFDRYYQNLNLSKNRFNIQINEFFDFLKNEKNYLKSKQIVSANQRSFFNFIKLDNKKNFNDSILESSNDFLHNFIFLLFFLISSYLLQTTNDFEFSKIIYCFSLINISNSSTTSFFDYLAKKNIYKKADNILNDLEFIYNKKFHDQNQNLISVLKKIEIKNLFFSHDQKQIFNDLNLKIKNNSLIVGGNGLGKTTLLRIIMDDYSIKSGNIFFNDIDKKNISLDFIAKNFIYVSDSFANPNIDFSELLNYSNDLKNKVVHILKVLNLNIISDYWNKLSSGEKQILFFISLVLEKNKIILLDESLSNVNDFYFQYLMKEIKPLILKNNFLVLVSHNLKIKNHFTNIINI